MNNAQIKENIKKYLEDNKESDSQNEQSTNASGQPAAKPQEPSGDKTK